MALKMDLKGIFIFDIYDILLQIATWTVDREQSTNKQNTNKSNTPDTVLRFFWKNKNKNKKNFKTSVIVW